MLLGVSTGTEGVATFNCSKKRGTQVDEQYQTGTERLGMTGISGNGMNSNKNIWTRISKT
jgi:hypothetical protein